MSAALDLGGLQRRMIGHAALILLVGMLAGIGLLVSLLGGMEVWPGNILPLHLPAGHHPGSSAEASQGRVDSSPSGAPTGLFVRPHPTTAAFASPAAGALIAQVKFARAMSARLAREAEGHGVGDSDSDAGSDASSGGRQMVSPVRAVAPAAPKVGRSVSRAATDAY